MVKRNNVPVQSFQASETPLPMPSFQMVENNTLPKGTPIFGIDIYTHTYLFKVHVYNYLVYRF